jgi:hypothetical protein
MRKPEDDKIDWEGIKAAIVGGEPFRAVAERHGIKASRISMRSTREGWRIGEMRGIAGVPARAEGQEEWRKSAALVEAREEVGKHRASQFSASLAAKGSSARLLERVLRYVETLPVEEILARHQAIAGLIRAAGGLFWWQAEEPPTTDGRLIAPAINLALVHTSPEQLRQMKEPREELLRKQERKIARAEQAAARVVEERPGDGSAGV